MPQYPRYAIYFVPSPDAALYRFGMDLLGYDAYTGKSRPFADGIEADVADWKQIAVDPSKYGFHATLKAPISLASDRTEDQLAAEIEAFSRTPRAIPVITPVVRAIGAFVAVVPHDPCPDLQKLADDCVIGFDDFRAPLTPEDRKRRNVSALTDRQIAHLHRWGYPYVLDDFRFHMTLTGSLAPDRRTDVLSALHERFAALNLQSTAIDRLALLRQSNATSNFTIISHWPLCALDSNATSAAHHATSAK